MIAALAGFGGVVVGSLISWVVQASLLGKKFNYDRELAERKFAQEKAQLIHRRRFELAESLLADAYRFRDLMRYARSAFSYPGEGGTRKPAEGESESMKHMRDGYFVPIERLQRESEFISAFMAKEHAAHAHFGSQATNAFGLFRQSFKSVQAAAEMLIDMAGMPKTDPNVAQKMRGELWADFASKDDEGAKHVNDGVSIFETFCRPVLEWTGA